MYHGETFSGGPHRETGSKAAPTINPRGQGLVTAGRRPDSYPKSKRSRWTNRGYISKRESTDHSLRVSQSTHIRARDPARQPPPTHEARMRPRQRQPRQMET